MTDVDRAPAAELPPKSGRRRVLLAAAAIGVCLLLGLYLFLPGLLRARTNDAYVEAHVEAISSRVPGYVLTLRIDDNSRVRRGQVLLELDARDYRVRVATAQADLATARGRLEEAYARSRVANESVEVAEARAKAAAAGARLAADDLRRFAGVSDVRAVSTRQLDAAEAEAASSRATLSGAEAEVGLARADAVLARTQERTALDVVRQAKAALMQAQLNLSYTHIIAPEEGSVADKLVERGNYVEAGQTLLSLVPTAVYVVANFEETQLRGIAAGSPASVSVDALPGLRLRGHVESIQRGTGSQFALLPPENATGNFVKIVQRIPVKIVLDEPPRILSRLAPGMSAVVSVRYSKRAWLPPVH